MDFQVHQKIFLRKCDNVCTSVTQNTGASPQLVDLKKKNLNSTFGLAQTRIQWRCYGRFRESQTNEMCKEMIAKAVLAGRMCYNFSWTMYRSDPQAQQGCFHQLSMPRVHILFSQALQSFYVLLFSHTVFVSTLGLAADRQTSDLRTN